MPYRKTSFVNDHFYHIFNRGVEKRKIFSAHNDYQRFIETLCYYQFTGPKPRFSTNKKFKGDIFKNNPKMVDIICYCFMPNHFHLLVRQKTSGGIQEFIGNALNSYTKYFNTKYKRVGPLFQGVFKDAQIETDEQLLHTSRYIHLNPYVSSLTDDLTTFPYSSYNHFVDNHPDDISVKEPILDFFKNPQEYKAFVHDQKDYAKSLDEIKHLLLEEVSYYT